MGIHDYEPSITEQIDDATAPLLEEIKELKIQLKSQASPLSLSEQPWINQLQTIIHEYRGGDESLDGEGVDRLVEIIKAKINLHEGNLIEPEYNSIMESPQRFYLTLSYGIEADSQVELETVELDITSQGGLDKCSATSTVENYMEYHEINGTDKFFSGGDVHDQNGDLIARVELDNDHCPYLNTDSLHVAPTLSPSPKP